MVSQKEFDRLVEEALETLPPEFLAVLENIAVLVEQEPAEEDLDEMHSDEGELLGIFRGVPRTEMSFEMSELPAQIVIFRGPVLRCCASRAEAIDEIRDTVIHELGHYFGLDDHEMPY